MPFDGSGNYSRVYDWTDEQAAPPIEISKLDAQEVDMATALSNCVLRDGTGRPTSAMDWNSQNLSGVAALTAQRFIPSSSTIPANGLYLPAANTPGIASNTTLRWSVNGVGNHTFAAPTSGTAVTINGFAGATTVRLFLAAGPTFQLGSTNYTYELRTVDSTGALELARNDGVTSTILTVSQTRNLSLAAPGGSAGSNTSFAITQAASTNVNDRGLSVSVTGSGATTDARIEVGSTTNGDAIYQADTFGVSNWAHGNRRSDGAYVFANAAALTSNVRMTLGTANADAVKVVDDGGTLQTVGWRDLPQSTNTSLVLADRGKHIYLTGTTNTVTIPANGSVAFPTGSTIVIVNNGSGNTTLQITSDTLEWFQGGASSTGTRTIATKSVVTLVKVASTTWVLSGSGIS